MKINIRSILVAIFMSIILTLPALAATSIDYKIHINPTDLSGYDVEMRIPATSGTLRVAMAAHPEYDDRYWRYIENVSANDARGSKLSFVKEGGAVWRIANTAADTLVRYRLRFPPQDTTQPRDAWKPFLTPTGGMVGDLHSLMYVVGATSARARLTLDMPTDWSAASGLDPTADPRTFTAPTELMLDAPVIVGKFREWKFNAGAVPHKIIVWSPAESPDFDAAELVSGVRRLAQEAIKTFGPAPYKRYAFLFQNGGEAALEHLTSVNIGHDFSRGLDGLFEEVAHEYFHAWNLMDVRPKERVGLQYKFAPPTGVLWWNEGATIMFADYLVRRTGLSDPKESRVKRLEIGMARYFSSPGYVTLSAETASRGDSDPSVMGDYFASTHLQGELLSTMLDLTIRDNTRGRRGANDVMTLLANKFDYRHGITNKDIENAAAQVCPGCEIHGFFKDHIYGAKQIDFDRYLGLIGLRAEVARSPALNANGRPAVDLRIAPLASDTDFKIRITNPQSAWGRAGLHTGDRLLSVDGSKVSSWTDLRAWLHKIKIGDTGHLEIMHDGVIRMVHVPIRSYEVAAVAISEFPNPTPRQIRLRSVWTRPD